MAPGIDRIVMLLAGASNLRDVIMFPMNQQAQDLLMGAPSEVTPKQLRELHIRVVRAGAQDREVVIPASGVSAESRERQRCKRVRARGSAATWVPDIRFANAGIDSARSTMAGAEPR